MRKHLENERQSSLIVDGLNQQALLRTDSIWCKITEIQRKQNQQQDFSIQFPEISLMKVVEGWETLPMAAFWSRLVNCFSNFLDKKEKNEN